MKKNIAYLLSAIVAFMLACNLFPAIPFYLGLFPVVDHHYYESNEGGFRAHQIDGKGGLTFEDIQTNFSTYKKEHNLPESVVLCRNFKKNYLKFWYWRIYLTDPRYQLPYKESTAKNDPKKKE